MIATNACEAIQGNPQLRGVIERLVSSVYAKNRDLMTDSSYDCDDLMQELMLKLCDEEVRPFESHYQRLCTDRLKNIIRDLSRELVDYNGESVSFDQFDEELIV